MQHGLCWQIGKGLSCLWLNLQVILLVTRIGNLIINFYS